MPKSKLKAKPQRRALFYRPECQTIVDALADYGDVLQGEYLIPNDLASKMSGHIEKARGYIDPLVLDALKHASIEQWLDVSFAEKTAARAVEAISAAINSTGVARLSHQREAGRLCGHAAQLLKRARGEDVEIAQ